MTDNLDNARPNTPPMPPKTIDATFRNGSLTAFSVIAGFSLSFLTRWAGLPGPWQTIDLAAVLMITLGIASQVAALAHLLSIHSLLLETYNYTVKLFLIGLALVAAGVGFAIAGDIVGHGQRVLTG